MAFQFKRRTQEAVESRASQQGGGFDSFLKDEYRSFKINSDNSIRILPRDAREDADHYGQDVWVHYNVGPERGSVICPYKMANEPCPVCEEHAKAERRGDDEDTLRQLKASRRVLVWLIDRKNEEQGPVLWAMPWTVDRDISKACKDRETGSFYFPEDPQEGYDVYFDRSGTPPRVEYGGFQLSRKPNSVSEKILEFISQNPLMETLRFRGYDEIKMMFEGASRQQPPADKPAETEPSRQEAPKEATVAPPREADPPPEPQEQPRDPPPKPTEPARVPEPALATHAATPAPAVTGAQRAEELRKRFAKRGTEASA
jgi:gp32 DNA binding protein like